jgi:hypothetical protein
MQSLEIIWDGEEGVVDVCPVLEIRIFDKISFRKNFAKQATKRFSCFTKTRDEFRQFRSFAKLQVYERDEFHETRKSLKKENLKQKYKI